MALGGAMRSWPKRFGALYFVQLGLAIPAAAQSASEAASRWQSVLDGGARYYSWSNSIGGRGAQLYVPAGYLAVERPNDNWKNEYLVRSGFIWTRQSTASSAAEAYSMTDTTASAKTSYYGFNGVQPFAALSVNIPTAHETTSGSSTNSSATNKTDSDIVATPTFGEGWNIGPSVGANFSLSETTVVSFGLGYTYRGPFVGGVSPGTGIPPNTVSKFKPGDVTTINAGLGWSGERTIVQMSLSYSMETTSYQDGAPLYRSGGRINAGIKGGYSWDKNWSTRAAFNFSHFEKNEVAMAGLPNLVRETLNSNSDVYRITIEQLFSKDNYSIGPSGTYLVRNHNGYDPSTFQFIPAKTSWSAGLSAQVIPTKNNTISARVEHIWVREDNNPDKFDLLNQIIPGSGVPMAVTQAWVVSIGGNTRF